MLAASDLTVGYHGARGPVLSNLNFSVARGAFVCVLGRNGAGKSTLMRTLAGLQQPLSGHAVLDGRGVGMMQARERARDISVVLTERLTSPGLTVRDVVELGRQPFTSWHGSLSEADHTAVTNALTMAGAAKFVSRRFDDLSDGERQRVMIARAIAQTPKLMILDEITAFLDLPGRVEIMALLRRHARDTGTIVLLSSHDLDLSLQLADTVWLLDGAGALHLGAPDELATQGWVGKAFDTQEVTFSTQLRRFELRHTTNNSRVGS
jgi:iron complex transport system ATP-binding protein